MDSPVLARHDDVKVGFDDDGDIILWTGEDGYKHTIIAKGLFYYVEHTRVRGRSLEELAQEYSRLIGPHPEDMWSVESFKLEEYREAAHDLVRLASDNCSPLLENALCAMDDFHEIIKAQQEEIRGLKEDLW